METVITLIRHGETLWNRDGRWQGHADIPLSDAGRAQARQLAAWLAANGVAFHRIYTSDLARALETAQIVAEPLGIAVHPLLELRELDVGIWSGLSRADIAARYPEEWHRIQHAGEDLPRGGAERWADMRHRTTALLARLAAEHPGAELAVVTHGGVVRGILEHAYQHTSRAPLRGMPIDNTSLTRIAISPAGWRVLAVNQTAHIANHSPAPDMLAPTGEQSL